MRAIQRSSLGAAPSGPGGQPALAGWSAMSSADPYGAASTRKQQIRALRDQGYSLRDARAIVDLDVGGTPQRSGPDAGTIAAGIVDIGGALADVIGQGLQAGQGNTGSAGNAQQAMLAQQGFVPQGPPAPVAPQQSNTALYAVLGVGLVAGLGFLAYAVTR